MHIFSGQFLAMIAVVVGAIFVLYSCVSQHFAARDIQIITESLIASVRKYYKPTYSNVRVSDLISLGTVPDKYLSDDRKSIVTEFGNIYIKHVDFDNTRFIIEVVNIPSSVCNDLLSFIKEDDAYNNVKVILNYDESNMQCFKNSTNSIEFITK